MNDASLLLIEGNHADCPAFAQSLRRKGFPVELVASGNEALTRLGAGFTPELIIVNAATLRTSGKRICHSLKNRQPKLPLLLIMDEDRILEKVEADEILTLPFTVQKLVNRIRHLKPGDGKNSIHAGPINLDMEKRMVTCMGRQTRLTPQTLNLLKSLIEKKGEVIDRKVLFSKVWETNYTEDTRTLDVHISWLRQAIEKDPDKPQLLRTIRGIGYRLDV